MSSCSPQSEPGTRDPEHWAGSLQPQPGMAAFASHPCLPLVFEKMRWAVAPADERLSGLSAWLTYHLGWTDLEGQPAPGRSGKSLRAGLCLHSCQALGGDPAAAISPAAAIELTHAFSLIHDDIEDGDHIRRGRPSLWSLVGVGQAINAGDVLWAIAQRLLVAGAMAETTQVEMVRRYAGACRMLAEGQYLDLLFEGQTAVSVSDYLAMVARKTGALFGAAAALGALAGGGLAPLADRLTRYGEALGIAFQIQDDILGLWSTETTSGKPVARDLQRGKKTLPVLLALEQPDLAGQLRAFFALERREAQEALALADLIADAGVREQASAEARRWSATAVQALPATGLMDESRALLESLAWQAVSREL